MAEKEVFRCVFTFLEKKYADTPSSNIFLKSYSKASATATAIEYFEAQLKESGFTGADYRCEVFPSSMNEAILYAQQKKSGKDTARPCN